jgi:multicomponent Na+:H+ antiporter subunit E
MTPRTKMDTGQFVGSHGRTLVAFLILFVFWLFITASFSIRNIVLGLLASFLVTIIVRRAFGIRLPADMSPVFLLVRFPIFLVRLAWDVIKANINLAYILLRPRLQIDPTIVRFKSQLRGDFRNTVLGDSITVTPGTLTLDAHGDELVVHCLTPSHERGLLDDRHCERLVLWLFDQRS